MQKLKIDKNKIIPAQYPVLPFLIDIALLAKKRMQQILSHIVPKAKNKQQFNQKGV